MSFLTDFTAGFAGALGLGGPPAAERLATTSGDVDLVPAYLQSTGGLYDALRLQVDRAASPAQLLAAYNDVFGALVQRRAAAIGYHLSRVTVQRQVDADVWEDVEREHNWHRLVRRPNGYQVRDEFYNVVSQQVDLDGDSHLVVERGAVRVGRQRVDGVPVALHMVWPEMARVYPALGGRGEVVGWEVWLADGTTFRLAPEDVVRIRQPHPVAPHRSASLAAMAGLDITADRAASEYVRDTMGRRGLPDVVLETDEELTGPEGIRKLVQMATGFAKQYGARGGRYGVPVSHKGARVKAMSLNARDQEIPASRDQIKNRLHLILGWHEGLFSKDANRANVEGGEYVVAKHVVLPAVRLYAAQLEHGLEVAHGSDPDALRLEVPPDVVPADEAARLRNDRLRIDTGTPINRVLEERGEEGVGEAGDVPLVTAGLTPLAAVVARASTSGREPSSQPRPAGDPDGEDDDEPESRGRPVARAAPVRRSLTDRQRGRLQADLAESTDPVRAAVRRFVERAAEETAEAVRETEAFVQGLTSRKAPDDDALLDLAFDLAAWLRAFEDELTPALYEAVRQGFAAGATAAESLTGTLAPFDEAFFYDRQLVADTLTKALEKATSVPASVRDDVAAALAEGAAAGEGPDELAARVAEKLEGTAGWRAEAVARTSGGAAVEAAAMQASLEAGLTRHRWVSVLGATTRESHAAVDGEEVAIGDAFSNGLLHPKDPSGSAEEVINCLCFTEPVV